MQKVDYIQRSRFDAYFIITDWYKIKGLNFLFVHAKSNLNALT